MSPVIPLKVNNSLKTGILDTGSSQTLVRLSAIDSDNCKIKKCKKLLYGISKSEVKTIGEITVNIQISPFQNIFHNVVVVPDNYLSFDYLIGMDLLDRTNFSLNKKGNMKYFFVEWCAISYY